MSHDWKRTAAEQESVIDHCIQALNLIPDGAMRSGATWMPSPEALVIISLAKDRLHHYEAKRAV